MRIILMYHLKYLYELLINPCAAELFQLYFSSFEAGIANAICSSKWRKIFIFSENVHLPNWLTTSSIWLTEHLPQTHIIHFRDILFGLKVIYHPLYGMNNYVLIWGDWLSCDPLRGSHDSQSPHIRKHLCPILWQLWFICHKFIHTI